MKLKKTIFPEILYGLKGQPQVIKHYKETLQSLLITEKGIAAKQSFFIDHNENLRAFLTVSKIYKEKSGKNYYIPKEFARALSKIDRAIPVEYFPEDFIGYFQFADDALYDDDGQVEGGFVYIGKAKNIGLNPEKVTSEMLCVCIAYINETPHMEETGPLAVCRFTFPLEQKKIDELTDGVETIDYSETGVEKKRSSPNETSYKRRTAVVRALINSVLYIHSQDSEIMKLRPLRELTHSQRREHRKKYPVENLCTVPIQVLHWGYHQKLFSVDETTVQTHLRWQPCGPSRSQVKLIWVKEHIRRYNVPTSQRLDKRDNHPKDTREEHRGAL